jgi:hypothetical protein
MPLDPSIPLQVQQQSPFAALQQPIQTAATLQGLRQNQTRLNANQAISDAYRQSVDPNTGEVDFGKLQALASQNGAGAFLPEFMGQIAQQRNSQLQYETGQLEQALKQQQAVRSTVGSVALDPNLGKTDMSQHIAQQIVGLVQSGVLPQDMAIRELKSIPGDPALQAAWVRNHLMNSLSGEAKIKALMPQVQAINTGGATNVVAINPMTGEPTVTGTMQNTVSPDTLVQNVETIDPVTGRRYAITKGQQLAGQGGAGGAPQGQGYNGRYQQGGVPGGILTSLGPSEQSALTSQGTTSNTAAQELHNAAADAPMRLNLLQQARDMLQYGVDKDGNPVKSPLNTGPGSDWRNNAKSFFNALSPDLAKKIGWTGDVQRYDEFKKILTNYASSVSGSLGSGTDARLNAAITGNANPNISSSANEDILTKTIAAEKMRAAQDYAFQNARDANGAPLTTDKFNQWQSQWNKAVNPDAFVYASMSPEQRTAYTKRVGTTKAAQTKRDLINLARSGVIDMGQ